MSDELRRFGPKAPDHPSVGATCPAGCGRAFKAGDWTTLVTVRPASEKDQAKADAGRPYTAQAAEVHWECRAGGPGHVLVAGEGVSLDQLDSAAHAVFHDVDASSIERGLASAVLALVDKVRAIEAP